MSEQTEREALEACDECGGSGYFVGPGCCGNFARDGSCRGHCAAATQYECPSCGGGGFWPAGTSAAIRAAKDAADA